jgi:aspartate aminotransferase
VLREAGYDLASSEATFFLYPKVPDGDDLRFAERLSNKGVMVLPAAMFHHQGHFRISLTTDDEALEHGLSVLATLRLEYD